MSLRLLLYCYIIDCAVGVNDPLDQLLSGNTKLDPNSKGINILVVMCNFLYENYCSVLAALKKNFKTLFHCLPLNVADKIKKTLPDFIQNILPIIGNPLDFGGNPLKFNFTYTAALMSTTVKSDEEVLVFFDILENLTDNDASKAVIEILRDGKFHDYTCIIISLVHMYSYKYVYENYSKANSALMNFIYVAVIF